MHYSRVLYRFLVGYIILHLLMAGLFVLVLTRVTRSHMIASARGEMQSLALMLRGHILQLPRGLEDASLLGHLTRIGPDTKFRFTIINDSGRVLVDSEKGTEDIGPHGNRPEILDARENGKGFSERFSTTLGIPMMYLAIQYPGTIDTGDDQATRGYIRVAMPTASINQSIFKLQSTFWAFALLVSSLTAVLMAIYSSRAMAPLDEYAESARRIGAGDLNHSIPKGNRDDEWGELADAFEQMQQELSSRQNHLVENNRRMQAVLSSMIEGVLSTSSNGSVLMANRAACRMLSLTQSELLGRNLLDLIRYPQLRKAVETARTNRSFSKTEFETLDRPRRILKARVSVLADRPDLGVAIVLHDVTELRALETMRRDFVANVSHELKTPLASIKAYAETLLLGALYDEKKNVAFIEQIESQAELLNLQIQDLLELARVESGKGLLDIQSVSINDVCRDCINQLQAQADQRGLSLTCEFEQEPIHGRAEPAGVITILKNLISNAIHYTPAGGSVVVRTRYDHDDAVIEVVDTGIGIAKDQQARIFERFYRVDKARSRDMGGTGLGLAIVKHLTHSFGGSIEISSQVGKGSVFRVRLTRPKQA